MAIILDQMCDDCAVNDVSVQAEYELDSWGEGSGGGGFLCDNCFTNRGEVAHERSLVELLRWFRSGRRIQEHHDAADRQRAELRRRD